MLHWFRFMFVFERLCNSCNRNDVSSLEDNWSHNSKNTCLNLRHLPLVLFEQINIHKHSKKLLSFLILELESTHLGLLHPLLFFRWEPLASCTSLYSHASGSYIWSIDIHPRCKVNTLFAESLEFLRFMSRRTSVPWYYEFLYLNWLTRSVNLFELGARCWL